MKRNEYLIALALFSCFSLNGCSVIGYAIGGKLNNEKVFNRDAKECMLLDSAETITVITKKNSRIIGELIDYTEIVTNQYSGELPLVTNLNIRTKLRGGLQFDYSIPKEDIKEIKIKDYNYYGLLGFAIGLTIDAVIIYELIYILKNIPNFSGTLN